MAQLALVTRDGEPVAAPEQAGNKPGIWREVWEAVAGLSTCMFLTFVLMGAALPGVQPAVKGAAHAASA
jgi:hypothetical protein